MQYYIFLNDNNIKTYYYITDQKLYEYSSVLGKWFERVSIPAVTAYFIHSIRTRGRSITKLDLAIAGIPLNNLA